MKVVRSVRVGTAARSVRSSLRVLWPLGRFMRLRTVGERCCSLPRGGRRRESKRVEEKVRHGRTRKSRREGAPREEGGRGLVCWARVPARAHGMSMYFTTLSMAVHRVRRNAGHSEAAAL